MKDREDYLQEVESRLTRMFRASKNGHKASPAERHRLEGFIQAGSFLGLATSEEIKSLMDRIHFDTFGKTIEERQSDQSSLWATDTTISSAP
jgi:biopolymer transport protein ExbB/TolQ